MAENQDMTAALEGGPSDLPAASRLVRVGGSPEKIKVEHLGGYEHFERTGKSYDPEGEGRVVYRWILRTRIAE